jgi:hypothetical protein
MVAVLPNELGPSGAQRASLYVSPRLSAAPILADFPDLLDWPDLIERHGLKFTLKCGAKKTTVTAGQSQLRPDLWREIFKPQTHVAAYPRPDYDKRLVVSYPTKVALDYLQWAYQVAATSRGGGEDRLFDQLLPDLAFRDGKDSTLDRTLSELRVRLWQAQQDFAAIPGIAAAVVVPGKPAGVRDMAEQFALYHRLPPAPHRPPLPKTPADFEKVLDFHKAIAAITGYPTLMRALGLVFDVELPADFCPASPPTPTGAYRTVEVSALEPGWAWAHKPYLSLPETAYVADSRRFEAAPASDAASVRSGAVLSSDVVGGYLAMTPDLFGLTAVDLDGGMLKAMALADNFEAATDQSTIVEVLPSLRSGGVSLLANQRAQEVLRSIRDNTGLLQAEEAKGKFARPLNARDLVRGYRLDIWSAPDRRWCSLHRRDGLYLFGPDGGVTFSTTDEEGFIQLGVTQPADDPTRGVDHIAEAAGAPQPGTDLYVHERIARWNGWSLSAARPGQPLNRSSDPSIAADPDPTANEPVTPFRMKANFTVRPGSLPRLRFSGRYKVRARAADLAGNSPTLGHPVPVRYVLPAGDPAVYYRFEPVPAPVVVPRRLPRAGGQLLRMAIRSYNAAPDLDGVPTGETDERHLVPPKAGLLMVEHHGMLDDAQGKLRGDPATYSMIVDRDVGAFALDGQTPIEPAAQAVTPWFPDPIARGVALVDLPGTPDDTTGEVQGALLIYSALPDVEPRPGSVTRISFGSEWPDRAPFRLALAEGPGPPAWDGPARELTVFLPKAWEVEVPISCTLDPADLDLMGVWNWMREWFEAVEGFAMTQPGAGVEVVFMTDLRALLTRQVLEGRHEMITPAVAMTLVHATQQPIGRPTFTLLPVVHDPGSPVVAAALRNAFSPITAWRSLGSHHAVLLGGLKIHGKSSARVDLSARWIEYLDDLDESRPTTKPVSDHVEAIELKSLDGGLVAADGHGDRYVAVYVPQVDVLWFAAPFDSLQGVPPPFEVAAPVHQFGDTRHRRVRYRAVATSRFVEYFSEPDLDFTRTGDLLLVSVPSSARPAAPDVLYVTPTFGWERQETTNVKTEVRRGGGLRVYLNRPWYSSGEGELLGVVLWPQSQNQNRPTDDDRERNKAWFTQWGLDPVWGGGQLEGVPTTFDFPQAVATATDRTLEHAPLQVDVAGHAVGYDGDRRLWYCDIELAAAGAYAPFVRLALARYQPDSIDGTELSHVVLGDYAQLSPDRSAALTVDPASPTRGRLYVGGLAPTGPTRALIVVSIEERTSGVKSDLGWRAASPLEAFVSEDSPPPSDVQSVLWQGTIGFKTAPLPGRFRIVIREYELHPIDPFEGSIILEGPNWAERLVYASIITWDFVAP